MEPYEEWAEKSFDDAMNDKDVGPTLKQAFEDECSRMAKKIDGTIWKNIFHQVRQV